MKSGIREQHFEGAACRRIELENSLKIPLDRAPESHAIIILESREMTNPELMDRHNF